MDIGPVVIIDGGVDREPHEFGEGGRDHFEMLDARFERRHVEMLTVSPHAHPHGLRSTRSPTPQSATSD